MFLLLLEVESVVVPGGHYDVMKGGVVRILLMLPGIHVLTSILNRGLRQILLLK
jgi:hypothetical protein